jgi:hypothetical protein
MDSYTKLIPLLYPFQLTQNEWFINLYQNLIVSIFLENSGRSFTIDELISCIYRNYNLKINNVPELDAVLSILKNDKNLLLVDANSKYSLNPSHINELEDNYIKILSIDDSEDSSIIIEFETELKEYITLDEEHTLWKKFYETFCLPLVQNFFQNLIQSGIKNEREIFQNYKFYMSNFQTNKDEIHTKTLNFLKNYSTKFFKKHLVALIFFESVEADIKNYSNLELVLESSQDLDFFLERNIIQFMDIMFSFYSIEERIKSSTSAIASLLVEDSFQKNLFFTENANRQNSFFRKNLREESYQILSDQQKEWETIKTGFQTMKNEFSGLETKVDFLKDGIQKHSKLIEEARMGVETSVKNKHESSIHILKNKNVELVNKITEVSLIFIPVSIIILSGIFFWFNEYFFISILPISLLYIVYLFFKFLEIFINKKLIEYHQAEMPVKEAENSNSQPKES